MARIISNKVESIESNILSKFDRSQSRLAKSNFGLNRDELQVYDMIIFSEVNKF